jgi:hypothetical protein
MTIVLDTSVLIDVLRGDDAARVALEGAVHSGERLVASVLTRLEVLAGARPEETTAIQLLLNSLEWIAVDEQLADDAGQLAARYLRSHPGIDSVDYVIAASALRLQAALWTRNLKHFPMFERLESPY